jgi:hypothetical protein
LRLILRVLRHPPIGDLLAGGQFRRRSGDTPG